MFKKYKPFFRAGLMDLFAYKFNLFMWMFVTVFEVAIVIFLWIAVYKNSPDGVDSVINGFTFKEMICYMVMINLFNFVTVGGQTLWTINTEIKEGTISTSFVKPVSYRLRFISITLGGLLGVSLLIGLPCFTIAYLIFYLIDFIVIESVWVFIGHILLFLVAQLIAAILYDAVDYIFGILCFYTSSGFGINQIKNVVVSFLSGSLIPLTFFPLVIQDVVKNLPFASMASNPILILLMKVDLLESVKIVGISIFWLVILELIAMLLFRHASKKITVHGG